MKEWRGSGAGMDLAHQEIADAEREGEMRRLRQQAKTDPEAAAVAAPMVDQPGFWGRLRRIIRR
jgi:hypothetical protein